MLTEQKRRVENTDSESYQDVISGNKEQKNIKRTKIGSIIYPYTYS